MIKLKDILTEKFEIDLEVGDTILRGKFKNKPVVVKDFGVDDKGQPTINGKKMLSFRIKKLMPKYKDKVNEELKPNELKKLATDLAYSMPNHTKYDDKKGPTDSQIIKAMKKYHKDLFQYSTTSQKKQAVKIVKKVLSEGKLNEFEGKPIPMDTPNEFAYLDYKKWAYRYRSQYKKDMLATKGDSSKMFKIASSWWYKWAYKKNKAYTHIKDSQKFGRALIVMMVKDNLIFDKAKWKKDNRITHIKEDSAKLSEIITLPIEIGDVVMGGKFKNKKITVKEIGTNEKGDITINGKSILRVRVIPKDEK